MMMTGTCSKEFRRVQSARWLWWSPAFHLLPEHQHHHHHHQHQQYHHHHQQQLQSFQGFCETPNIHHHWHPWPQKHHKHQLLLHWNLEERHHHTKYWNLEITSSTKILPSTDPDGDEQWRTVGTGELVESPPAHLNPSLGKPLEDRTDFFFAKEGWVGSFSREGWVGNFGREGWVGKDGKLAATPSQRQSWSHMTVASQV